MRVVAWAARADSERLATDRVDGLLESEPQ
jgi:hypothetical protein